MNTLNECLLLISSDKLSLINNVTILEVLVSSINIDTVSGMARKENKSPNGIRESNQYRKLMIGCQKMAISGLVGDNMPF